MTKKYEKKDENTLIVTDIISETHITEEDRAEIQTELDHLELDKAQTDIDVQKKIDELKIKIAILDEDI